MARQFPNTASGIKALLTTARPNDPPPGRLRAHRRLPPQSRAPSSAMAGVPMVKVNPLQARRFAEAIGQRAKTDAVDAAMARPLRRPSMRCRPRPIVSQTLSDMKEIARRPPRPRQGPGRGRQPQPRPSRASTQNAWPIRGLRQVERQIAAIDTELRALCRADAELKARLDILVSHPGHRRGDRADHAHRDARTRHDR